MKAYDREWNEFELLHKTTQLSRMSVSQKKKKTLKISLQTWKNDENCRRRGETLCNLRAL